MLQEGAAQPLDHAADRLAVQGQRVDDATDILDDEAVKQFDIAGPRVDRDMRRGRSVSVGQPVVVTERRCDPQAGRGLLVGWSASHGVGQARAMMARAINLVPVDVMFLTRPMPCAVVPLPRCTRAQ